MRIKNGKIKYILKRAAAVAMSLVFVFIVMSATFAWFEKVDEGEVEIEWSSFEIKSRVWFDFPGLDPDDAGDARNGHDGNGFYRAEVTQPQSGEWNFYANLRIDVLFRGIGANYARILITEKWVRWDAQAQEEIITRNTFTNFLFDGDLWIDNRQTGPQDITNDGYFYYNNITPQNDNDDKYRISYAPSGPDDYLVIPLITGLDSASAGRPYPDTTYLKIKVLSEAVQANRFPEKWKRAALPQR